MVVAYLVSGGPVTMERIFRAIDTEFSGIKVLFGSRGDLGDEENVVICEEDTENMSRYTQSEHMSLENDYMNAVAAIEDLERKQHDLYSQFELLRSKYDTLVSKMSNLLWSDCTPFHPELKEIPPMETADTFVESKVQIGPYKILEDIGEGQFAKVKNCIREDDKSGTPYAVKVIHKDKITSLTALRRVSSEIKALRKLKGAFVTGFRDAIQTKSTLYIVLEKGGSDLFDFFDKHPGGVPEVVARKISIQLLNAILFCHQRMYCHRDIKPENILISFNEDLSNCKAMLCDFGLCSKFDPKLPLHEFCGSPGFFDPEMVSKGSYFGDKADIWSFGAVFLEMILGHETFCDIWMLAYDYDCVQDREKFVSAIGHVLDMLPKDLESAEIPRAISDFLFCILQTESTDRSEVIELLRQPWFGCEVEISAAPTPPRNISSMNLLDLAISDQAGQSNSYESSIT